MASPLEDTPGRRRLAGPALAVCAAIALSGLGGCAVIGVAGAAVSVAGTAVGVGASVVGLAADAAVGTVRLGGKAIGAAADAVLPDPAP
ncbi:hypothetical protein NF681_16200 [Comamonadaceae bacterium OTU4NAUVB1]|nr:hypothetical protein NF681_16200 [Comamonadaceae bacterium OTU4NAUVB1]HSU20927.1 hypothetical protein [Variovorax sp.]